MLASTVLGRPAHTEERKRGKQVMTNFCLPLFFLLGHVESYAVSVPGASTAQNLARGSLTHFVHPRCVTHCETPWRHLSQFKCLESELYKWMLSRMHR